MCRFTLFIVLVVCVVPIASQTFTIKSIDASAFPKITSVVRYSAVSPKTSPLNATDLMIVDAGSVVPAESVTCSSEPPEPLHICFVLDFKNYEPVVRNGLKSLLQQLPMPEVDVSILSTFEFVQVVRDFTRSKIEALDGVDQITTSPGLDLERAFYSEPNGAVPFVSGRTGRTMIVFISDLHCPKFNLDEARLFADASKGRFSVSSIILGTSDYTGLFQRIATGTKGVMKDGVYNSDGFAIAIERIWASLYGTCVVEWTAPITCESIHNVSLSHQGVAVAATGIYVSPTSAVASWVATPRFVRTAPRPRGTFLDTIISVIASKRPVRILSVTADHPDVVLTPSSLLIDTVPGTTIRLQWPKNVDSSINAVVTILTEDCGTKRLSILQQGITGSAADPLVLRVPNGGEEYVGGSVTTMTYDGVPDNTVVLGSISVDKGATWSRVASGTAGQLVWNVPPTSSDSCLAQIEVLTEGSLQTIDSALYSTTRTMSTWYVDPLNRWLFMSGAANETVVYDAKSMIEITRIPYTTEMYGSIGAPDNTEYMVMGVSQSSVNFFDGTTLSERRRVDLVRVSAPPAVVTTPSGKHVLVKECRRNVADYVGITVMDTLGNVLYDTNAASRDVCIDPNGEYVAWIYDTTLVVVRLADRSVVATITTGDGMRKEFRAIRFSHDGKTIAAGTGSRNSVSIKREVMLIDTRSGQQLKTIDVAPNEPGNARGITGLTWTDNDNKIVVVGTHISVIDVAKLELQCALDCASSFGVASFDLSPDERYVAYHAYWNDSIRVVDLESCSIVAGLKSLQTNGANHRGVHWSADGRYIYESLQSMPYNVYRHAFTPPPDAAITDFSDSLWRIVSPIVDLRIDTINMGVAPLGSTKDSTVVAVLCNKGGAPLSVTGIDISSGNRGDFNIPVGGGAFVLEPGECRDLLVEFLPMAVGYREARATIKTTIGALPDSLVLIGNGVRDRMEVVVGAIDFGRMPIGTSKDTNDVPVVVNDGVAAIGITRVSLKGPDASSFSILNLPAGQTLAPNDSLVASVRYTASAPRRHSAWIEIEHNGPLGLLRVHLFGEGVEIVPAILGLDTLFTTCSAVIDTTIFLTNIGEGRMIVSNIEIQDVTTGPFDLLSAPASPFVLWPGDTTAIRLRYTPLGNSPDVSSLLIHTPMSTVGDTLVLPLIGYSSNADLSPSPSIVRISSLLPNEVVDTLIEFVSNAPQPTTLTLTTVGAGISLLGPPSIDVPLGPQVVSVPIRCIAPTSDSITTRLEVRSSLCPGLTTVPITLVTTSITSTPDTIGVSIRDVRANVGDTFSLVIEVRASPSSVLRIGPTLPVTVEFNATLMLPIRSISSQPVSINGTTGTIAVSIPLTGGQGAYHSLAIPFRALLGKDSTSILAPQTAMNSSVHVELDSGVLTINDLCSDNERTRLFDGTQEGAISLRRSGDHIDVFVNDKTATSVTVVLMDLRGAVVPISVTDRREADSRVLGMDLGHIASGRYALIVERKGRLQTFSISK